MTESDVPNAEPSGSVVRKSGHRGTHRRSLPLLRHQARSLVLQVLFEADLANHAWQEVAARTIEGDAVRGETSRYFELLLEGIMQDLDEIDLKISGAAPQFPVDQLAPIDRSVLRIAIFELRPESDVPTKVAINEAIELAKHYGGDNSGRFVNGALAAFLKQRESSQTIAAEDKPVVPSPEENL